MEQKSTYTFVLKCKFSELFPENDLEKLFTTISELFRGYNSFADKNEEYVFPKILFSFNSDGKNVAVKSTIGYSEIQEEIFDKLLKKEKEKLQKASNELEAKKRELEAKKRELEEEKKRELEEKKRELEEEKKKLQAEWKELAFLKKEPELQNIIDENKLALDIEKELRKEYGLQ